MLYFIAFELDRVLLVHNVEYLMVPWDVCLGEPLCGRLFPLFILLSFALSPFTLPYFTLQYNFLFNPILQIILKKSVKQSLMLLFRFRNNSYKYFIMVTILYRSLLEEASPLFHFLVNQ